MPQNIATHSHNNIDRFRGRVLIRLETLIRLRWWAILGQTLAVVITQLVLDFPLPWMVCLLLIAVSALLNLILTQRFKSNHRLSGENVFYLMVFDIMQLGVLLFLTGGLQNPFAILLIAPVTVSATSLRLAHTLILGALAALIASALVYFRLPLPWFAGEGFELPLVYVGGVWVAILCTVAFTAIYAFRVAEEARKLADALTATELVLQREQHLSVLDGLAAAAAHELGTPLATIALVSKEMVNMLPAENPMHEDAKLLRSQAQRCREILQTLTSLSSDGEDVLERQTLAMLVEESVAPLRDFGVEIIVDHAGKQGLEPQLQRNPAVLYGLGNLIDNAIDFASTKVLVSTNWTDQNVTITVQDDGPGFPPDVLHRIGEPFVTTRAPDGDGDKHGMGLGLFIAKTLLERNGAEIDFNNLPSQKSGNDTEWTACVVCSWPRVEFEKGLDVNHIEQ